MATRAPSPAAILAAFTPDHACTQDQDLARKHTGDTTEQDAGTAGVTLEVLGAFLHCHAAGDLGHRGQEREFTTGQLYGLIGQRDGAGVHDRFGERLGSSKVEVGEEKLALPHVRPLGLNRLLDLHDHFSPRPDFSGGVNDLRTCGLVEVVREARSHAAVLLDHDLVPLSGQSFSPGRSERHTVLFLLDFLRNADQHLDSISFRMVIGDPVRSRRLKSPRL